MYCEGVRVYCCRVIKLSSSWESWGVSGELLYDLSE